MKQWLLAVAFLAAASTVFARQEPPIGIAFSGGSVTLTATDAPVADVLATWARIGHAELAGAEYLGARRISIRLTNANEAGALQAIIGSTGWYSTVPRESPTPSESVFQRIVIQPAAVAAANASSEPEPEKLRSYPFSSDPDAAAQAAAAALTLPAVAGATRPPAGVEPESFYHYDRGSAEPPDRPELAPTTGGLPVQPMPQGAVPEAIYAYSPVPEPLEPTVASAVIPPQPALEPEARFTYDAAPEPPPSTGPVELVIPNIPTVAGFAGMRVPGRVIRYVTQ